MPLTEPLGRRKLLRESRLQAQTNEPWVHARLLESWLGRKCLLPMSLTLSLLDSKVGPYKLSAINPPKPTSHHHPSQDQLLLSFLPQFCVYLLFENAHQVEHFRHSLGLGLICVCWI